MSLALTDTTTEKQYTVTIMSPNQREYFKYIFLNKFVLLKLDVVTELTIFQLHTENKTIERFTGLTLLQ